MTQIGRKILGEDTVQLGLDNRKMSADFTYRYEVERIAREEFGLETYISGQGKPSSFWDPCKALYPKRFPMMQDFVNWAHSTLQSGDPVYFADWLDFMEPQLPQGEQGLRDHINATTASAVLNGKWIPQRMDYSGLLAQSWLHPEIAFNPVNTHCFQYAADIDDPQKMTWISIEDENKDPIVIFNPEAKYNDFCYTTNHNL